MGSDTDKKLSKSWYNCKSVVNGWQTQIIDSKELYGPAFNKLSDLWAWQKENLDWRTK